MEDTCLYVTGSAGRGELSDHSDLDLFLIRDSERPSRLDEMVIGAAVVRALNDCGLPPPSKDGEFLAMHRVEEMLWHMGRPADDARNLFTARMLLLLESRCIEGAAVYGRTIDRVLEDYWRNARDHVADYLPIVLLNDICRYWRIVLLNYEAKQNPQHGRGEAPPQPTDLVDRRLRSHKLRFSRCLLCYSAIAFLLAEARTGNVTGAGVRKMVQSTPLERFERVAEMVPASRPAIDELLDQYGEFLERMNFAKDDLVRRFEDQPYRRACADKGEAFGTTMFRLVEALGQGNRLYRYLVV